MSKIKFRAWNDRTNSFVVPEDGYSLNLYGDLIHNGVFARIGGEYTLMQFTGLLDENGVEIYEGDIIDDHCQHIFVVENITPIRKEIYYDFDRYDDFMSMSDVDYEVIGNIYENHDLIDQKEKK